jgi:Bacterial Ig domain
MLAVVGSTGLSAQAAQPPRVAILTPPGGSTVSGNVAISIGAQSPYGFASLRLRVDGKSVSGGRAVPSGAGLYRFAWNSRAVANGRRVFTAVALAWTGAGRRLSKLVVSAPRAVVVANPAPATSVYPIHTDITSTVFWIGEPKGNGSSESNALSAYDDDWERHYGGYDNYQVVRGPPTYANDLGFTPAENPFYLDLPYDDVNNPKAFADRCRVVPWAGRYPASDCGNQEFSYMKNQWVKIWRTVAGTTYTAYGQIEDAGPYVYDDEAYVFGDTDARPESELANNAGMDVSPALRDYLHFTGVDLADQQNGDSNKVSWQFVDPGDVPAGPWKLTVTTRQVYHP